MGDHWKIFKENVIEWGDLAELESSDLEDMGIHCDALWKNTFNFRVSTTLECSKIEVLAPPATKTSVLPET